MPLADADPELLRCLLFVGVEVLPKFHWPIQLSGESHTNEAVWAVLEDRWRVNYPSPGVISS